MTVDGRSYSSLDRMLPKWIALQLKRLAQTDDGELRYPKLIGSKAAAPFYREGPRLCFSFPISSDLFENVKTMSLYFQWPIYSTTVTSLHPMMQAGQAPWQTSLCGLQREAAAVTQLYISIAFTKNKPHFISSIFQNQSLQRDALLPCLRRHNWRPRPKHQ